MNYISWVLVLRLTYYSPFVSQEAYNEAYNIESGN